MNRFLQSLSAAAVLIHLSATQPAAPSSAELSVVATIPDLADIARRIGGERVDVKSIAKGTENVHAVQIRPSDLIATSRADVFLELGLSLEHAWVPGLLLTAKNDAIEPGARGFMNVSDGWPPIQVPETLSRSQGVDIHPQGNPHFNLDPRAGRHMAEKVLEVLSRCDPAGEEAYQQRYQSYLSELDVAEKRWGAIQAKLAGRKLVQYHQSFDYLLLVCGLETIATLEPKPGVPPTPSHLTEVIERMQREGVKVIVTAAWSNTKTVRNVAEKTGAVVLELPNMVGGAAEADTWIGMMDLIHRRLAEAFGIPMDGA